MNKACKAIRRIERRNKALRRRFEIGAYSGRR